MEFIETPAFTRHLSEYLDDNDYRALQTRLAANPDLGDVMPGAGGFRKMRWVDPGRGKGRRGGLRIIYFYFRSADQIWLMTLYNKSETSRLNAEQNKALKLALEAELRTRAAKRVRNKGISGG